MDPLAQRVAARFASEQKLKAAGIKMGAHVDPHALEKFQAVVSQAEHAIHETVRSIMRIDDPEVEKATWKTFHDMLKLEVSDYQKMMHEVEKELR